MSRDKKKKSSLISHGIAAQNRKARFDYKVMEEIEAGLQLIGPEVKSWRSGRAALAFMAAGGHGCISVTANIAPRACAEMHRAWREGRLADAMAIQERLTPVHDAMFCETSPGPVKYAASLLGRSTEFCRLPMAPVADSTKLRVREAMVGAGLLN
ncbi:MAG: SsrA-binding protein [Hyphomicrobiales bacterium]|nr:SsrA-binding protein [Hyphomicrobiales bacterium]